MARAALFGLATALCLGTAAIAGEIANITVQGSDTTTSLMKALAKAYADYGGTSIDVQGGGSTKGAKACIDGAVPMTFMTRHLKDEEKQAGLVETPYAMDAVAIVVHKDNPVSELSMGELRDIFSGKTATWPSGQPIVAFKRNEDSATQELVQEKLLGKELKFGEKVAVKHDGVLLSTVAKVRTAIAFTSAGEVDGTVKVLKVDGVAPSPESVRDQSYPIRKTLILATKGEPTAEIKGFIDFVLGDAGQKVVRDRHFVPLRDSGVQAAEAK